MRLPRYALREGKAFFADLEAAGCEPRWIDGFSAIECLCPLSLKVGKRVLMRLEWRSGGYLAPAPTGPAA
jgi:hypothetical protein